MSLTTRVIRSAFWRPRVHRYGPDHSQAAELFVPRGSGPFPVAVLLHGGYWRTRYGKLVMRPLAKDLADRGIAAWNLEYRRLGEKRGGGGGWPMTFDDVAAGIDALADLGDPRLDLDRVGALGHSAGGQLALWAGARPSLPHGSPGADPRVAVRWVVALAAVSNLAVAGDAARELMGGSADEVPDRYALADPVRRVPLTVGVLLVHASDDQTVPVQRSREYFALARAAGADVAFVETPAGGHREPINPGFAGWADAARWISEILGRL